LVVSPGPLLSLPPYKNRILKQKQGRLQKKKSPTNTQLPALLLPDSYYLNSPTKQQEGKGKEAWIPISASLENFPISKNSDLFTSQDSLPVFRSLLLPRPLRFFSSMLLKQRRTYRSYSISYFLDLFNSCVLFCCNRCFIDLFA
jgi:hypothetical protein